MMDVPSLRRALRLVHCLQKERGASCAFLASSSSPRSRNSPCNGDHDGDRQRHEHHVSSSSHHADDGFAVAMQQAREATDIAARRLMYHDMSVMGAAPLHRIRKQINDRTSQVHRMLVIYSTLISNVEHEYVKLSKHYSQVTCAHPQSGNNVSSSYRPKLKYQRSRSTNDFEEYEAGERIVSIDLMEKHRKRQQLQQQTATNYRVTFPSSEFIKPCSDPALFMPSIHASSGSSPWVAAAAVPRTTDSSWIQFSPQTIRKTQVLVSPPKSSPNSSQHSPSSQENVIGTTDRTLFLLNLLACLVRLKESTGMQRAVISCMVLRQDSQQMLLTSLLLLEVENQRKLVAELQHLPLFDYSLQTLVQDSVVMGRQLELLQEKITHDFDLQAFHDGIESLDVWNMLTVYVDKLYAVEMLLVEELEYCTQAPGGNDSKIPPSDSSQDVILTRILGNDASNLAEMPSDVVKQRVVEFFGQSVAGKQESASPPPPPPPPSSGPGRPLRETQSESILSGLMHKMTAEESSNEWQINLDEITFYKRIGRGSAGTTYLAKWSGQTVAVKVAALSDIGLEGWTAEVQSLQRLHHPNVIRLLGSVYNTNPLTYCLVLEYCNSGDLSNAMKQPTPPNFFMSVATDIANGMAYLHKRGVLHRDIKPSNVLLDGSIQDGTYTAKVSDFGVATSFYEEADDNRTAETGTYRWMAPEIIRHEPYSLMADVYSSGILFWQLLTRETPFQNVSPLEAAGKVALELARPPFPAGTPADLQELIGTCWSEDPSMRLTFQDISKRLLDIRLTEDELTWLLAPMGHAVYNSMPKPKPILASSDTLQVPSYPNASSSKPPLNASHKEKEKRASGFRRIFAKK